MTTTYASLSEIAAPRPPMPGRRWAEPASSRVLSLAVVALLHVLLAAGLVNVLAYRSVPHLADPLRVRVFDRPKAPEDEVKPPPPKIDTAPPPFVPLPEVAVSVTTPPTTAIAAVTTAKPVAPPPPPPAAVARVAPVLDTERSSDPVYPPISRRMSEEGLVTLLVLIGPDGSVIDAKVEKSSGYARLDQAALDGAKTRCRFKPGTVDGKPEAMWYRYRYQFKLT